MQSTDMKSTELYKKIKRYYSACTAGIITDHEFIIVVNCILAENNIKQETRIGHVVVTDIKSNTSETFWNKWIYLPDNDLIIDFLIRDISEDLNLPRGIFNLEEVNRIQSNVSGKKIQYRGRATINETNSSLFSYIERKLNTFEQAVNKTEKTPS